MTFDEIWNLTMLEIQILLGTAAPSGDEVKEARLEASFDLLDKVRAAKGLSVDAIGRTPLPALVEHVREFLPKAAPVNDKLLAESVREYLTLDHP